MKNAPRRHRGVFAEQIFEDAPEQRATKDYLNFSEHANLPYYVLPVLTPFEADSGWAFLPNGAHVLLFSPRKYRAAPAYRRARKVREKLLLERLGAAAGD